MIPSWQKGSVVGQAALNKERLIVKVHGHKLSYCTLDGVKNLVLA